MRFGGQSRILESQKGDIKQKNRCDSPPAIASGHMNMVAQSIDISLFIDVWVAVFLKISIKM